MKILIFLHGTAIMHEAGKGCTREERVRQSRAGHPSARDYANYVPIGDAAAKLRNWGSQGAEIHYLSSHRDVGDIERDRAVLARYGFPAGILHFCKDGQTYARVAARLAPDVIIEDDCESIGGTAEMVHPNLDPAVRAGVRSVVVHEFEGINHLPDRMEELRSG